MRNDGWQLYKLGDLLCRKGYIRGPFGSALRRPEMKQSGIPVYEQQHAIYNSRDFRFFIDDDKLKELSRFQVQAGDLIISCSGTLGRVSIIKEKDPKGIISQALLLLRPNTQIIRSEFLKYYFSTPLGFNQLVQASYGSVQQNIASRQTVESIEVKLPLLEVQERILNILSSLDDKIELNLQMNKTLEAIAQAIFKEWFVDFRFPGFDGELVDGLPKGWENGYLTDVLDLKYGKALRSEERIEGIIPVVGSSGIVGTHNSYLVEGPGIVIGRKGTIGKVNWIDQPFYPIDTTFFVQDKLGANSLYYHYFVLLQQSFHRISTDSAVPGLNRNEAMRNKAIIPSLNIVNSYNETVLPLFDKMKLNAENSISLMQIRDLLLPKLMSGKTSIAL